MSIGLVAMPPKTVDRGITRTPKGPIVMANCAHVIAQVVKKGPMLSWFSITCIIIISFTCTTLFKRQLQSALQKKIKEYKQSR